MNASRRYSFLSPIQTKSEPILYEFESEIVILSIINKIISLSFSKSFKEQVDLKVPKECYDYLKESLNNYLESQFIAIDKEEEKNKKEILSLPSFKEEKINKNFNNNIKYSSYNLNFNLENIFFSNYYRGNNNWNLIEEPKENKFDRYASTLINYIIPENKIPETLRTSLGKIEEENIINNVNSIKSRNKETKKYSIFIHNKNSLSVNLNKKKTKNFEYSFHDITNEENNSLLYNENIDLNELRNEKIIELKKKEDEKKKLLKAIQKEEEHKKEEQQIHKQYEKKKLTIDPNGEIVFIKEIKVDNLAKEFRSIKTNMRLLKTEKPKEENIKKKEIIIENNTLNNNNNINNNNIEKNKEDNNNNNNNINNIIRKRKSSLPKLDLKEIEKSRNIIPVKIDRKYSNSTQSLLEKKLEKGPIYPIGSLFDKINLEIGVSMKENKKFKTGGKDFYLKYNKYSLETYNKKLKDTISSNINLNLSGLKTIYNINSNSDLKKDFNFNESISSNLNQGMNTVSSIFNNKRNYNISEFNSTKTLEMNSSLNPLIKLTGNFSLKSTINDLDLINENQINHLKQYRKNIFKEKNKFYVKSNKQKFNEMNQFTKKLISSNEKWGSNIFNNEKKLNPIKMPNKPLKKEIEKEVGINGIIMRNRINNKFSQSMKNFGFSNRYNNNTSD